MPPERRTVFGVHPNTVRLSTGIEKTETLLDDIEQALGKLKQKSKSKAKIDPVQIRSKKKVSNYSPI